MNTSSSNWFLDAPSILTGNFFGGPDEWNPIGTPSSPSGPSNGNDWYNPVVGPSDSSTIGLNPIGSSSIGLNPTGSSPFGTVPGGMNYGAPAGNGWSSFSSPSSPSGYSSPNGYSSPSSPSTSSIPAEPAMSNEAFENGISGFYDIDRKIHGDGDKNPWYNVEITWNPTKGAFTWRNRAGVTWTLTPMMGPSGGLDRTKLAVGKDCPYKNDGHEFAKIEWVS